MPIEFPEPELREPTDLERYGHWQDVVLFMGLFLLGAMIAMWFWGG
jgi:hypothetical protein